MRRTVQSFDAHDSDFAGAQTPDFRPHRDQAVSKVGNFRLARRIDDFCGAMGQGRRHHRGLGCAHRDERKHDLRALEPARRLGRDITFRQFDFRTHRFQRREMQFDGPRTDGAAAGQ